MDFASPYVLIADSEAEVELFDDDALSNFQESIHSDDNLSDDEAEISPQISHKEKKMRAVRKADTNVCAGTSNKMNLP